MKQKAVWLVAGGPMQLDLAREVQKRGLSLIVSDSNSSCVCASIADAYVEVDTMDIGGHLDAAERLSQVFEISACLTVASDAHCTVAHLSNELGIHGVPLRISEICQNKFLTRQTLTEAGLPQPRATLVENFSQAKRALGALGGRGAIKALGSSGSRGFRLLNSTDELTLQIFEEALAWGPLGGVVIEESLSRDRTVLAEQSVETLWVDGHMYWLNWVDRIFEDELTAILGLNDFAAEDVVPGVELGHINPATHGSRRTKQVKDMVRRAGHALGFGSRKLGAHILKFDILQTTEGPVILEVTPRLSGGWDSSGTSLMRGADFQSGALLLALGIPFTKEMLIRYFSFDPVPKFAAALANVQANATNCIGREFGLGTGDTVQMALEEAHYNLRRDPR